MEWNCECGRKLSNDHIKDYQYLVCVECKKVYDNIGEEVEVDFSWSRIDPLVTKKGKMMPPTIRPADEPLFVKY